MENVIFLDIDGVLNTYGKGPIVEERMVEFLKNEIIKPTGAEIVLTSSWRSRLGSWAYEHFTDSDDYWDCNKLIKILSQYGINIAGRTPQVMNGPEGRPFEVRLWLAHHPHVKRFVILDDESFWEWNWLNPYVVETYEYDSDHEMVCGLTAEKAKMARDILLNETIKQG